MAIFNAVCALVQNVLPKGYCFELPYANIAKAPKVFERKTRDY